MAACLPFQSDLSLVAALGVQISSWNERCLLSVIWMRLYRMTSSRVRYPSVPPPPHPAPPRRAGRRTVVALEDVRKAMSNSPAEFGIFWLGVGATGCHGP